MKKFFIVFALYIMCAAETTSAIMGEEHDHNGRIQHGNTDQGTQGNTPHHDTSHQGSKHVVKIIRSYERIPGTGVWKKEEEEEEEKEENQQPKKNMKETEAERGE